MKNKEEFILGIWDGHDSGAALVKGKDIIIAVNEERFTKRKLEVSFPVNAINEVLTYAGLKPENICAVACSTSDFAKTLGRIMPSLKEEYYLIRRRKKEYKPVNMLKKKIKYVITQIPPNKLLRRLNRYKLAKELKSLGFNKLPIYFFDHHQCHAETAARTSGLSDTLVITLDGLGDGLSGTISTFSEGILQRRNSIPASSSFGIFFEHVTNIMNMRELEDEGKVMAMADYAYHIDESENPMIDFFKINGIKVKSKYSSLRMYDELKKIHWHYPLEQFAFMAQQCIESWVTNLVKNSMKAFNQKNICLAGGIFANIKLNMKIRCLDEVRQCFIFQQMGDGGLALGFALALNYLLNKENSYQLDDVLLGREYSQEEMEAALKKRDMNYQASAAPHIIASELLSKSEIIIWFQGRMEYGPRALGSRSFLARPDCIKIKDQLNLYLKKRVWFQPFCPSMMVEEAPRLLSDYDGKPNAFMTMGYAINSKFKDKMQNVISIDGSCRPQMVQSKNKLFYGLLKEMKKKIGVGVVLNTSLNIHGYPLACSPDDAIDIFLQTDIKYMIMGNFLVKK